MMITNLPDALLSNCMSFVGEGCFFFVAGTCRAFRDTYNSYLQQHENPSATNMEITTFGDYYFFHHNDHRFRFRYFLFESGNGKDGLRVEPSVPQAVAAVVVVVVVVSERNNSCKISGWVRNKE